ncbi:hypothetical protein [Janthinobacterium sp. ROICE36]|uniref:hypothetical protein n=1 Tax=Janthinobacterium sp. ROICE36 TaxID=2048670 RepID=UPI0011AFACCB|nr:hypothetical protein [Janthinobacterium sp. ROICE36]
MQPSPSFVLPSFTGAITLTPASGVAATFGAIILDAPTVAALSGALDGASVHLVHESECVTLHVTHPALASSAEVTLQLTRLRGKPVLHLSMDQLVLRQHDSGLDCAMLARIVSAAQRHGIGRLTLQVVSGELAIGQAPLRDGAAAWIALGFDAPLALSDVDWVTATPELAAQLPAQWMTSLADLLAHPDGPALWGACARDVTLIFDLRPGWAACTKLAQRLRESGRTAEALRIAERAMGSVQ